MDYDWLTAGSGFGGSIAYANMLPKNYPWFGSGDGLPDLVCQFEDSGVDYWAPGDGVANLSVEQDSTAGSDMFGA